MKEKLKNLTKKLIISIMLILIFLSEIAIQPVNISYAAEEPDSAGTNVNWGEMLNPDNIWEKSVVNALDGVVGIFTWIPRVGGWLLVNAIRELIGMITALNGVPVWDIDSIIFTDADGFDGTAIVSVDFFNLDPSDSNIKSLRENIVRWYYSLRNLAAIILLGILIYVGIRMAITTVAEEEAKYKKMFKDWVVSFVLLFVMHYIMVFTIELNKVLVTIVHKAMTEDPSIWGDSMNLISADVFCIWSNTIGTTALIMYTLMVGITVVYLIMYIKRMLTVGFLIMISPLITITYSIDKIKDNKSQALDTWLKEFIYNILIQPFHCIIYVVLVHTAMNIMHNGVNTVGGGVLAIIILMFMFKAEEIVKHIFNFQSSSIPKALGNAAIMTSFLSSLGKDKSGNKKIEKDKIPDMTQGDKKSNKQTPASGQNGTPASNQAQNNMDAANTDTQTQPINRLDSPNSNQNVDPNINVNQNGSGGTGNATKSPLRQIGGMMKQRASNHAEYLKERFSKENMINNIKEATSPGNIAKAALGGVIGTMMFGATGGDVNAAMQSAKGVSGAVNNVVNDYDEWEANKAVKQNESEFAGIYNEFQQATGWSDKKTDKFVKDVINGKAQYDEMDENQEVFASYIEKMGDTYQYAGENNVSGRMKNTLDMIHNDEIEANETSGHFTINQNRQAEEQENQENQEKDKNDSNNQGQENQDNKKDKKQGKKKGQGGTNVDQGPSNRQQRRNSEKEQRRSESNERDKQRRAEYNRRRQELRNKQKSKELNKSGYNRELAKLKQEFSDINPQ